MSRLPNLRFWWLTFVVLIVGTALFSVQGWTQDSPQQRPVWDVQLARNGQASSNITIQNQCQQPHSFTVTAQQTPFLQFLAAPAVNVPGKSSYNLPVRFNTNGLNAGQYQGTVVVKCETCRKEKTCQQDREILPIQLTVMENMQSPQATPTATAKPSPTPAPTPADTSATLTTPAPSPSPSPCEATPSPTTYTVKNLGPLDLSETAHCVASGVNEAGNVVGGCSPSYFGASGGAWHAFRTEPGVVIDKEKDDLGLPVGVVAGYSFAMGVNADGHVVGVWSAGVPKAFWHKGSKSSKMLDLHDPKSPFSSSRAFAINVHDYVVGVATKPDSSGVPTFSGHAVIWPHADPALMKDLNEYMDAGSKADWTLVAAFGINDAGEIVGRALNIHTKKFHAFLLKGAGGKPIDLGALKEDKDDSSAAYAINACDKVVGYTYTKADNHFGFVWTEGGGMTDVGTLPSFSGVYTPETFGQAINKKGEVVGAAWEVIHNSATFEDLGPGLFSSPKVTHAVWYNGSVLKDLNKLIPDSPGWELMLANGINDKGLIVGDGKFKGASYLHAVLLTPAGPIPTAKASTGSNSSSCPLAIATGYVFDNWNICPVKNGPTKDSTFTIDKDYLITFIATYHWNDGSGALPAKGISIKDGSGKIFGPWAVITSAGSGGRANVNWECHPGIALPPGTYTVIDPDPATWSQNDGSGNSGFTRVAGSPVKK